MKQVTEGNEENEDFHSAKDKAFVSFACSRKLSELSSV